MRPIVAYNVKEAWEKDFDVKMCPVDKYEWPIVTIGCSCLIPCARSQTYERVVVILGISNASVGCVDEDWRRCWCRRRQRKPEAVESPLLTLWMLKSVVEEGQCRGLRPQRPRGPEACPWGVRRWRRWHICRGSPVLHTSPWQDRRHFAIIQLLYYCSNRLSCTIAIAEPCGIEARSWA